MRRRNLWITFSLVNLCILALLGVTLRTKFLFPVRFIDYRNILSAHSHFAFGGWVTLSLMILYIENLLGEDQKRKNVYQFILWGVEITSLGMAISFPFKGYAFFSILFSSTFIFFTFGFVWVFLKDLGKTRLERPVPLLSIVALLSLVLSSVGPFTLAWIMSTHKGNAFLYKNAIYTYLHLQYNGFFIMSVFALFFQSISSTISQATRKKMNSFAILLSLSIIPSLFLSLLWRGYNAYAHILAVAGCGLIILSLVFFLRFIFSVNFRTVKATGLARLLLILSMISFVIKMILQTGTIIPSLHNAVFGYRPIIIGFLHLVFLGLISFYILSDYLERRWFNGSRKFSLFSIIFFATAIILNETILFIDGMGLMFHTTHPIYPWLLWGAAILLFFGALLMLVAKTSETGPGIKKAVA